MSEKGPEVKKPTPKPATAPEQVPVSVQAPKNSPASTPQAALREVNSRTAAEEAEARKLLDQTDGVVPAESEEEDWKPDLTPVYTAEQEEAIRVAASPGATQIREAGQARAREQLGLIPPTTPVSPKEQAARDAATLEFLSKTKK